MRILVVSDLHYSLKQFDWLCHQAEGYDLLVIAGDLLDLSGHADLDTQIVVVEKYLSRLARVVPVAACSGNHDLDADAAGERWAEWLSLQDSKGLFVDGQSFELGDCLVSICPWWDGPESQRAVAAFIEAEAPKRTGRWIWLYHAPPDQTKICWTAKGHVGDRMLTTLIETHAPDLVFCGHVHNSPFSKGGSWCDRVEGTWVFNPGRQLASEPASIVLDLDLMEATWDSSMDRETQALDALKPSA